MKLVGVGALGGGGWNGTTLSIFSVPPSLPHDCQIEYLNLKNPSETPATYRRPQGLVRISVRVPHRIEVVIVSALFVGCALNTGAKGRKS
jgi:hypothetical protein